MSRKYWQKVPFGKHKYDEILPLFIETYWRENLRAPTIREMADACGEGASVSHISQMLPTLVENLGYIVAEDGTTRGVCTPSIANAIRNAPLPRANGRKDGGK